MAVSGFFHRVRVGVGSFSADAHRSEPIGCGGSVFQGITSPTAVNFAETGGRGWHVDSFARMELLPPMRPTFPSAVLPHRLWRAMAWLASAMAMLLTMTSVSPELHAWLHEKAQPDTTHVCPHHAAHSASHVPDSTDDDTHQCAVTLFSHGVVHQAATLFAQPCEGILHAVNYRAFERLALAQPRYLHLPPQAPPAV